MSEGQKLSGTVRKAFDLLDQLSREQPDLSVAELAERAALDRTTTYRLLETLARLGVVTRDARSRRYRLGLRMLDFANATLDALEVRYVALSHLIDLQRELVLDPDQAERTVFVAVPDGRDVVLVETGWARWTFPRGSRMRFPAYASAAGRCILAHVPATERDAILADAEFPARTPHTLTTRGEILERMEHIRRVGFDISDQEVFGDLRAIAVPVLGQSGSALASIGVSAPAVSTSVEKLIDHYAARLTTAAQRIAMALRHRD